MASVYLRGKIWWGKYGHSGETVRKSMGTTDRAEAQRRADALEADAKGAEGGLRTVAQVLDRWLAARERRSDKPRTIARYRQDVNRFTALWGSLPAKDFSAHTIDRWIDAEIARKRKGALHALGPTSLNTAISTFIGALHWAAEQGADMGRVPKMKALPIQKRKPQAVPEEDIPRLFALCRAKRPDLEIVLQLALLCGLRADEIRNLRWKDCLLSDPNRAVIIVQAQPDLHWTPKDREDRPIPLAPQFVAWLESVKKDRGANKLDFLTSPRCRSNEQWGSRSGLNKPITALFGELGIRCAAGHVLHMLRNSFANRVLRRSGGNLKVLKDLMGHSDIKTSEKYLDGYSREERSAVSDMS